MELQELSKTEKPNEGNCDPPRMVARGRRAQGLTPPKVENAPGLVWKPRKVGWEAHWQARTDITKRGFRPYYARIWAGVEPTPEEREQIARTCQVNQEKMLRWSADPEAKLPRIYAGHIYFITDGEAVKIGFSQDVIRRMGNMQTENHRHLKLLASITGSVDDEYALQRRFRHLHIRGDWFRLEGELIKFIGTLPAGYTVCKRDSKRRRLELASPTER